MIPGTDGDGRHVREVQCGEHLVPVLIRRGRRKTLAIHVFPDKPVELRAPLKCSWSAIDRFLDSRRAWIAESLISFSAVSVPTLPRYVEGEMHYFLGQPLRLKLVEGRTRHVCVAGDALVIRCDVPGDAGKVEGALEDFYRREAKWQLPDRVAQCRERFKDPMPPSTLKVRKMRARWGHCSQAGEICLNTRLMARPLAAVDFVVTHELCHLRHFGHNKSFYGLMDRVMPDWREREKLLAADHATLQLDLF